MFSIKTPNRKKVKADLGISKDQGFKIPPSTNFFDCKEPKLIHVAKGAIIESNPKRKEDLTRRGPEVIQMPRKSKREVYKIVKRDKFLPERQVFYSLPSYPYRKSEEEIKQSKIEDIQRNGQLVQLSNKTLNNLYEKFDLLTIGDDIIRKIRTGEISKTDARASALLALSREIKNALKRGEKTKVDKVIQNIQSVSENLIPKPDEIEIKDSPIAELSLVSSVVPNYDANSFIVLTELLRNNIFYLSDDNKVNSVIDFDAIANSSINEIENSYLLSTQDERLEPYRETLRVFLDWYYKDILKAPQKESMVDEPVIPEPVIPEPVIPEPVIPETVIPEPVIPETVIPEQEELVPIQTRKKRDDEFYEDLSRKEVDFIAQVSNHIVELTKDLENIIKKIDIPSLSVESKNVVSKANDKSKEITGKIDKLKQDLKEENTSLEIVEGEIKLLTNELEKLIFDLADRLGEESKKPVDVLPPPPPVSSKPALSFLGELLGKKKKLKKGEEIKREIIETPEQKKQRELQELIKASMTRRRAGTATEIQKIEPPKKEEQPIQKFERDIDELLKELRAIVGEKIKDYGFQDKLSPDEEKVLIDKGQKVGSKEDVWNGLAVQSARINGLRREDLTYHQGKVKSIRAVVGSMSRVKPTRTKK